MRFLYFPALASVITFIHLCTAKTQTVEEAAVSARHLVHREKFGVLNSIYQDGNLKGDPVGLVEYFADCGQDGDLTMLAITISTPYQQWAHGSPLSMAIRTHAASISSPAAHQRISLQGNYEFIEDKDEIRRVSKCFFARHPDAIWWKPGNKVHESRFVTFNVTSVYYIGGFGNTKHIGFIPIEMYQNVTEDELAEYATRDEISVVEDTWRSFFVQKIAGEPPRFNL